jgi:2-polyprenyl-3-methyl-5-hydroxy-6-metoxy-1,4-benzoquinol methylase
VSSHRFDSCPICDGHELYDWAKARDIEYFTTSAEFTYRQCPACKTISIDPVPLDQLDLIYPSNYYANRSTRSFVQRIKNILDRNQFAALLSRIPGDSLSILDIGGASGAELTTLRQADPRVGYTVVVDPSRSAEPVARNKGHDYFCGTIEEFRSNRQFDLIVMLNLIEHVRDPISMLRKAAALLAPQGLIVVQTPNVDSLDCRLFRYRSWAGLHCPRHWVIFQEAGLQRAVTSAGLVIDKLKYVQGASFWTASILGILHDKGLVSAGKERPLVSHPAVGIFLALFAAFDIVRAKFSKTSQMFVILKKPM